MIKRHRFIVDVIGVKTYPDVNKKINYIMENEIYFGDDDELKYATQNNYIINIIENNLNDERYEIIIYYKVK